MKEMKMFFRRRLALLLALTLTMTMVPSTLFAENEGNAPVAAEVTVVSEEPITEADIAGEVPGLPAVEVVEAEGEDSEEPIVEGEDSEEPIVEVEDSEKPVVEAVEEEAEVEEDPAMDAAITLQYNFDPATGTLTISSSSYENIPEAWSWYEDFDTSSVKKIIIKDKVQSIQESAFSNCYNLEELVLGDSVTDVAYGAFGYADKLKKITIGAGILSFDELSEKNFPKLEQVSVSSKCERFSMVDGILYDDELDRAIMANKSIVGVRTIRDGTVRIEIEAFRDCKKLTSIIMPDSVTTIGRDAFSGCSALTSAVLSKNLECISQCAFMDCGLIKITIPAAVKELSYSSFSGCTKLAAVTFADNSKLKIINLRVFSDCSSLASIKIPSGVESILKHAFSCCTSLTKLTIPASVTKIEAPFVGCSKLKLTMESGNRTYCIVDDTIYTKDMTEIIECVNPTSKRFFTPNTVTTIAYAAFAECSNLEQISVPRRVASIDSAAFAICKNLKSVTMPWVKEFTFQGCDSLKNIYFLGSSGEWNNMRVFYLDPSTTIVYNAMETADAPETEISDDGLAVTVTTSPKSRDEKFYYHFLRSTDGGVLKDVKKSEYKYWTDQAVLGGHTYDYAIQYKDANGNPISDYGPCTTVVMPGRKLAAPTMKSAVNYGKSVKVTWKAVANAEYYEVLMKAPSDTTWRSYTVTNKTYANVKGLTSGTSYVFTVRCVSPDGKNVWSTYGKSCAGITYLAPIAASNVKLANAKDGVKIAWKTVKGAAGYNIYRMTGTGAFERIDTVKGGTETSYTDKTAVNGKTYYYGVCAYKNKCEASYVGVKIFYLKRAVLVAVISKASGKLTAAWKKNDKASGYQMQYSRNKDFSDSNSVTITKNSTLTKTVEKLAKGKVYYVHVRAMKTVSGKTYYSAWSNAASVTVRK